jgi:flavin reductase (DIM6/NTAB) family NADH-FMN oxidoreductase RutF
MQARINDPAITRDMFFDFAAIPARERDKLLLSTVIPRPIAWIVSLDLDGQLNAAPFSFFNAFALDPPVVGVGIGSHDPGRPKDTRRNIHDTKEFAINLVSEEMARAMNITAIDFELGISELSEAEVDTRPSVHIKPPRIAGSPVAMECELMQIVDLGTDTGLVLGRVLAMHVREDVIIDPAKPYINTPKMRLIGRMHGGWYTRTSSLFQMNRISRADWQAHKDKGDQSDSDLNRGARSRSFRVKRSTR